MSASAWTLPYDERPRSARNGRLQVELLSATGNTNLKIRHKIIALLGLASLSLTAQPRQPAKQAEVAEQAVIVYFQYGSLDLSRLYELEDRVEAAIVKVGAGEYDGHEIAVDGSDGVLYMYGPNADLLFETVHPILETTQFMHGAKVVKRYGPPGAASKDAIVLIRG